MTIPMDMSLWNEENVWALKLDKETQASDERLKGKGEVSPWDHHPHLLSNKYIILKTMYIPPKTWIYYVAYMCVCLCVCLCTDALICNNSDQSKKELIIWVSVNMRVIWRK